MPLSSVDIAGGQVSGVDSLSEASSSVINWETDEAGVNRMRAGLVDFGATGLGTSPVIGAEVWNEYLILVTEDRKLWAVNQYALGVVQPLSDSTSATQLGGTSRPVFALGASYVYVTGGAQIQRWNPMLTYSEVISASPLCTHIAIIGARMVSNDLADVTTRQTFRWSDSGEGDWDSWPAANTSDADARADPIVGIYENLNELQIYGTQTLQIYQVGIDPTLPFDLATSTNIGLGGAYCVTRLDETSVFLDDKRRLVKGDGRTSEDFSSAIHNDLRSMTTVSDAFCYREERGQQSLLVFRFPTEQRTFVYDSKGQKWSERKYYSSPFQGDWPCGAGIYWPVLNKHMVGLSNGSGLAYLSATTKQDLGGPLVCERITGWQEHGTPNSKRSARIRVTMRRGTAAQGATPNTLEIRVQDEESSWTDWEGISVGGPGEYEHTRDIWLGGIFHRRRYAIRYTGTDDTSIVALADDVVDLEAQEAA